jgi:2'-5' RNA ligase
MKRTFIAIKTEPEEKIKDCIFHSKTCLKGERIKWVSTVQLHFTLAFLGDTTPDQVERTVEMLQRIVPRYDAPLIQYIGLGLFRNMRDPRVLWIGLDIDPVLRKLKAELDRELKILGFQIERRDFRPHLTLARIKWMQNKEALKDLLDAYRDYFFQESTIRQLVYYESVLGRDGPTYKVIRKVRFRYAGPLSG